MMSYSAAMIVLGHATSKRTAKEILQEQSLLLFIEFKRLLPFFFYS